MRKPNSPPAMQWIGGTMEPTRAITLLLKITEEFLGGVPRRGEVVIIPHSALRIK